MKIKVDVFENFESFHDSDTAGEYERITIIRENGWINCDLMTECKSFKTAIKRFFNNLTFIPEIAEWLDFVLESCECGTFKCNDFTMGNGEKNDTPGYAWEVEEINDCVWYIFLNVRAETKQ